MRRSDRVLAWPTDLFPRIGVLQGGSRTRVPCTRFLLKRRRTSIYSLGPWDVPGERARPGLLDGSLFPALEPCRGAPGLESPVILSSGEETLLQHGQPWAIGGAGRTGMPLA
ncbi:hypothetical protein NDU88_001970 [Pleurodeles waltl]|uniref:Uncharacterized protein n=1 Tax=Pleurodeles waltl TaxID=8319 RepID=A0AAV7LB96_PLEWA|nr:hypothetical protein NDU88_001970 [Pleurodeles waltl]